MISQKKDQGTRNWLLILVFVLPRFLFSTEQNVQSAPVSDYWLHHHWQANWIAPPNVSLFDYGVYHFRKTFDLDSTPKTFIIHVTADNRYRLFVNGRPVCHGPARGDLQHWRFESVDLAPFLQIGKNTIAAEVWNFGESIPLAQITRMTGFLVQGDSQAAQVVNTGPDWRVLINRAYQPIPVKLNTFIVVGPGDRVHGAAYPWGWEMMDDPKSEWQAPRVLDNGKPRGVGTDGNWMLVPRPIPLLEEKEEHIQIVRRAEGMDIQSLLFEKDQTIQIPPHSDVSLLLDQMHLTTAYPELTVSGGKGSEIRLTYAEALFDSNGRKGNRDDVSGRHLIGNEDCFYPDGGTNRLFRPLWFRTFRYIQMDIRTEDDPLVIDDFTGKYTGYPFEEKASFACDDPELMKIWEVGWRTARLCANETYYDCPYYEQLQYTGDTRIQALISLAISGDDRLMRNAIQQYEDSRLPEGLTQSRYPCSQMQIIPPYSQFWIAMIHDHWMYRGDKAFVRSFLPGIRSVIAWHEAYLDSSGMLGAMPWWHFVDWPAAWPWDNTLREGGVPPRDSQGRSSILSLQFVYALELAADLMRACDEPAQAEAYETLADQIRQAVYALCWMPSRRVLSDAPDRQAFSQHANVLGVLTDAIPDSLQREVMIHLLDDASLTPCTMYYRFYLFQALVKTGLGDLYVSQLESWREMLALGLTTFAERPEPTRSDCHAWSASPNYDLLATVCGIRPASPGFGTVMIAPHLGTLNWVRAEMPHPTGEPIRVELKKHGETGIRGEVTLPVGISGEFVWNGEHILLHDGIQKIELD